MSAAPSRLANVPAPGCSTPGLVFEAMVSLSLLDHYADKVTAGHIERNASQEDVLHRLEDLRLALTGDSTRNLAFSAGSRALDAESRRCAASTFGATPGVARRC